MKTVTMANNKCVILLSVFCFFGLVGCSDMQENSDSSLELGKITFPTSASGEAQQEFITGVLALHSFWYPEAQDHFEKAQELDPDFAMAYWGEIMTYDHPLWGEQHLQEEAMETFYQLEKRIDAGTVKWSEREKDYIEAARLLFEPNATLEERRKNFAAAMADLAEKYPDDTEARVFEALAAMSVEGFDFTSGNDVIPVAARLETVIKNNPEHPGALHYLIHVCDTKEFASRALPAAETYAEIAPASSHALHMPSHIFRHLGMWEKVVESNLDAWEASVQWQQETGRNLNDRDYHAFTWLFDAHLKLENYEEACNLLNELDRMIAEARERGEPYGYINGRSESLTREYREEAPGSAPQCN